MIEIQICSFRHWIIDGKSQYWKQGERPLYSQLRDEGHKQVLLLNRNQIINL